MTARVTRLPPQQGVFDELSLDLLQMFLQIYRQLLRWGRQRDSSAKDVGETAAEAEMTVKELETSQRSMATVLGAVSCAMHSAPGPAASSSSAEGGVSSEARVRDRDIAALEVVDGPSGPVFQPKKGAVHMAYQSGAVLVPLKFGMERSLRLA